MKILAYILLAAGGFWGSLTLVAELNTQVEEAEKAFAQGRYDKSIAVYNYIQDSLVAVTEPMLLNRGHARYFIYDSLEVVYAPEDTAAANGGMPPGAGAMGLPGAAPAKDSVVIRAALAALNEYQNLAVAEDKLVQSRAQNMRGISLMRLRAPNLPDSVRNRALAYFRAALVADPNNEAARYNYELLARDNGFPEYIKAKADALVERQAYKEAVMLMVQALQRDSRVAEKYGEYVQRLTGILQILENNP